MDYVRVKPKWKTGVAELSVPQVHYDQFKGEYDLVDKPATDAGGVPLAPKNKTSVSAEAAKRSTTSGQKADPKKES